MVDFASNLEKTRKTLCEALCAEVKLIPRPGDVIAISTPLTFPDGDSLPMFVRPLAWGGIEFTDMGNSLMRLSYDTEPANLRDGTRGRVLAQVLAEYGLRDKEGELILAVPGNEIGVGAFRFSQALTRVHDISFLNRVNVESTFYEDLQRDLEVIAGDRLVVTNYIVPSIEKAEDYPVDYFIGGP